MSARQIKRRNDARWMFLIRLNRDPLAQRAYFSRIDLRTWYLRCRKAWKRWGCAPGGA